jgi:hypothetical protein
LKESFTRTIWSLGTVTVWLFHYCRWKINYWFNSLSMVVSLFFFFFGETGIWTLGFVLTKQVLYHLSHASPVHFAWVILEMGVLQTICPGWPWTAVFPTSACS